jgi:hypothetical protein
LSIEVKHTPGKKTVEVEYCNNRTSVSVVLSTDNLFLLELAICTNLKWKDSFLLV